MSPRTRSYRPMIAIRRPGSRCGRSSTPARWWLRLRAAFSAARWLRTCVTRAGRGSWCRAARSWASLRSIGSCRPESRRCASVRCSPARPQAACAPPATAAISRAGRPSTWARRTAASRGNRSASRGRSSPCARSTSAGRRRIPTNPSPKPNSSGDLVCMTRNMAIVVVDQDRTERAVHRIQYGARLKVDEGDHIRRGQRIAEWDPYMRPILTEVEGTIGFEDLVEGQSMSESLDESTGIAKRVVIDWRTGAARGQQDLRPAMVVKSKDGKILKLARGGDARYLLAVDAILSVDPGGHVQAGDVHGRMPSENAKTRDITGGLPRVAELFEARRPKEAAVIAEISGTVRFGRDYKNKRRLSIEPSVEGEEAREYLIPKGKHIHLQDGDVIEKGDYIVEGNPAPHDILAVKGVEELAAYLVNEIQEVYRLQGVHINDKHIEVIVRQMLQKVEISEVGETDLIHGEQIDKTELDEINAKALEEGKKPAHGYPVLLGITKASLQTRSFISAASFQETTRVLTEAAVNGKIDTLDGLKENVIVGRLIPAGTGAVMGQLREVATRRDQLILDERAKEALKAAEQPVQQLPAAGEGRAAECPGLGAVATPSS